VFAGKIAAYFHISEEFMDLGKGRLEASSFSQVGFYRYSVGAFCLGHAFELLYKALLLVEQNKKSGHDFETLYAAMSESLRGDLERIIVSEGWASVDEFHRFLLKAVVPVHRKYFDASSGWDIWNHDGIGNVAHKLWPGLVRLWKRMRDSTASRIWKNPKLPIDEEPRPDRSDIPD